VEGNTAYAFDESAWQAAKIIAQTRLYTDLAEGAWILILFANANCQLPDVRHTSPTKLHPIIVVERHFLVERAGETIEVVLSTHVKTGAQTVLEWPGPVVPYRAASEAQSRGSVSNRYTFRGFGKVYSDHDRYFAARKEAITILDKHIDEFMTDRARRRDYIASSSDHTSIQGLVVSMWIRLNQHRSTPYFCVSHR